MTEEHRVVAALAERTDDLCHIHDHTTRVIKHLDIPTDTFSDYEQSGEGELPCMIWANRYRKMYADLEDGTEVILEGDIDYWTEGGKIDLKPWEVIVVGDGNQAAAVERLRSELEERGWFDDEQKQQPPAFPERVGVVTSLRGDARYDIQNAIHGQDPTVDILVKDATVQGSNAPTSIANGIHHLDRSEDVDAIIVGRGGGSDSNPKPSTPSGSRRRSSPPIPRWSPRLATPMTGSSRIRWRTSRRSRRPPPASIS